MTYSVGEKLYKYHLLKQIGKGNFGEVWLANDEALDAECALKILPKNDVSIDERLLEAKIGNKFHHKNLINIQSADVVECGNPTRPAVLIAMPFYGGGSVVGQLNSMDFLSTELALKCLIDILSGLEYLHESGYFHCDIKPRNILVSTEGEYVLSDYGITCYSPSHATVTPRQCYRLHTAPETIKFNSYDSRTDIYQVGLTALRLFCGISTIENGFDGDVDALKHLILSGEIADKLISKTFVPKRIKRIIKKTIDIDPDQRFQSALEMRRAFEKVALKGYCTSDDNKKVIYVIGNTEYRYEIVPVPENKFDFVAHKKNLVSGRETRVSKFCKNGLKGNQLQKQIQKMTEELL